MPLETDVDRLTAWNPATGTWEPLGDPSEMLKKGEAELGIHQISEILAVPGVKLVGPLPAEIQNFTVYAAGVGAAAMHLEVRGP